MAFVHSRREPDCPRSIAESCIVGLSRPDLRYGRVLIFPYSFGERGFVLVDPEQLTEAEVQPVFRANPFLVERGARYRKGELHISDTTLQRIDFLLRDTHGADLFVELEWNEPDVGQILRYARTLAASRKPGTYRLLWLIPEDWAGYAEEAPRNTEVKTYSRRFVCDWIGARRNVIDTLEGMLAVLTHPVTFRIRQEDLQFQNIIEACYFQGHLTTDRRRVGVGLRKQAAGRYLDLIRCICRSPFSSDHPDLAVLLVKELLEAPYYIEYRGRPIVSPDGFAGHTRRLGAHTYNRPVHDVLEELCQQLRVLDEGLSKRVRDNRKEDPDLADPVLHLVSDAIQNQRDSGSLSIRSLITSFVDRLALSPFTPREKVFHRVENQWIVNETEVAGYENDMAKRVLELAVLRRMLIPVPGVPVMWVLKQTTRREKVHYERVQCQNLRLNPDKRTYLPFAPRGEGDG